MKEIDIVLPYKQKIEHGGKEVRTLAEEMSQNHSTEESGQLAHTLFSHQEPAVKMVAVYIFGILAARAENALLFLKEDVSKEQDWRVAEICGECYQGY